MQPGAAAGLTSQRGQDEIFLTGRDSRNILRDTDGSEEGGEQRWE